MFLQYFTDRKLDIDFPDSRRETRHLGVAPYPNEQVDIFPGCLGVYTMFYTMV